jgi:hypothetical protein
MSLSAHLPGSHMVSLEQLTSTNFDLRYVNAWTTSVGGEIEQFWIYLQNLAKLHIE